MISENIYNDGKISKVYKLCHICGCKIAHLNNFARHLKSKRHKEVDYINNNRFEIQRIAPLKEPKNEIIIIK